MSSFLAPTSGKTAKGSAVQKAEQEENVQTKSFSDPKISDNSKPTSLQKMHSAVQAKLNIGSPGDKFEKEADETADKVMKMPEADVQKTHAGGDDQPIQKKSSRSNDEPDIAKKEDMSSVALAKEEAQPKVEENTISKKSFLQTELFDDTKDVRNDFINAKEDESPGAMMKEDESSVAQAKEKTPDVSMNEKEGYAQMEEEDSPAVSMKEDESPGVMMKEDESSVALAKEEESISKKSFLQTVLFNDDKDTRNDMLNAKFEFPEVPEIEEPKKEAAKEKPKEEAKPAAAAKAEKKAGTDPIKEPVDVKPLKKRKAPKIKKPKIQKKADESSVASAKEEGTISKKSFLQTVAKDENAQAKEEELQKKNAADAQASADFESSLNSTKGGGSAMSESTQAEMGGKFGRDFSNVKIHDNSTAAGLNKEIGAKAFTNQNNIYFNSGQYNENSDEGKKLLAHELTHTIHQGASGDAIQTFTPEPRTTTKESLPEPVNDGEEVKSASTEYYESDEDQDEDAPKTVGEMDEDDKEEAASREGADEKAQEVDSSGVAEPQEDRSKTAAEKTKKQKDNITAVNKDEQEPPEEKEEDGQEKEEKTSPTEAALQEATLAEQKANEVKEPLRLKKFEHPRIETPKDAEGEELPRNMELDTNVSGLANMAEIFRDHGLELQTYAAAEEKRSHVADAHLFKHKAQLANNEEVTEKGKEQTAERKVINEKSKPALKDSEDREKFVAAEAPKLNAEAVAGQDDAGELLSESEEHAGENKNNISDDPDAKADSEAQGEDLDSTAEGSMTIFEAILEVIKATAQYSLDAELAKEDNENSAGVIAENEEQIAMADARVGELDAGNAATKDQITTVEFQPEEMRNRAASLNDDGEEIIRASMFMEDDLKDIQEKYYAGMATVPGREKAAKEKEKKEEEAEQMSADQTEVLMLAGMEEEEQQEYIDTLPPSKEEGLLAALEGMVTFVDDKGTDESEGKRKKLDTGLMDVLDPHAEDPRSIFTAEHEDERKKRLQVPLDIADQNMGLISQSDKEALAMKLAGEAYVDEMSNIVSWQTAKDAAQGMFDPRFGLQGVVGGFEKMGSGLLNITNWEAWEKDPVGNLLQIGVDLSTGIAQMAGGVLQLCVVIQALMVVINLITWGFSIPFTIPEMLWMGSLMSFTGWVSLVAGELSVMFSSLAYTKNLHDAGTSDTAREFLGNVHQMKENTTDGTTGLMSILGGKGGIKMGPGFKMSNIITALKPGNILKSLKGGLKGLKNKGTNIATAIGTGFSKLLAGGIKGIKSFGAKLKKMFSKKKNKDLTPDEINKKTVAEHKTPDGHTQKVLDDGQVATCSQCSTTRNKYQKELDANPKLNEKLNDLEKKLDADPTNKKLIEQHNKLESQLDNIKNRQPSLDGDPPGSYRDKNGRLHGEDGKFIKDPNTPQKPEKIPGDKNNKSGSTEANRIGQEKHKQYRSGQENGVTKFKEYTGFLKKHGIKPDFVDFEIRTIFDLKPNNPAKFNAFKKQLENYVRIFEAETGQKWSYKIDYY